MSMNISDTQRKAIEVLLSGELVIREIHSSRWVHYPNGPSSTKREFLDGRAMHGLKSRGLIKLKRKHETIGGVKCQQVVLTAEGKKKTSSLIVSPTKTKAKKDTKTVKSKAKVKAVVPTTHIAFVIDKSSSMQSLSADVVRVFNQQLEALKQNSKGQNVTISVYAFSYADSIDRIISNVDVNSVRPLTYNDYRPNGMTALLDGVGIAIDDFSGLLDAEDDNTSFLIMAITDGYENASQRHTVSSLQRAMRGKEQTDRWSFAFLVPPNSLYSIQRSLGLPAGNIKAWEATRDGLEESGRVQIAATSNYLQARSRGVRSTKGFYETSLKGVNTSQIRQSLNEATGEFKQWIVSKEATIKDFVESKGYTYETGRAYYELTKPEKIQNNKAVAIMRRDNGKVYTGDEARRLIGIPIGETVKVKPGNHDDYRVFVASTSVNRRLVRGTTLLYNTVKRLAVRRGRALV